MTVMLSEVGVIPSNSFMMMDLPPSPAARTVMTDEIPITIPRRVRTVLDLFDVIAETASTRMSTGLTLFFLFMVSPVNNAY